MTARYCVWVLVLLVFYQSGLHAQVPRKPDKQLVKETFELFFESLRNKDSTTLKSIIYKPSDSRWFFRTFTGNHHRLISNGASRVGGVIREVGSENSLIGKCNNTFDCVYVKVFHRYATVSANYQCSVAGDSVNHSGIYTIHFLKPDDWKIERVIRYIDVPGK